MHIAQVIFCALFFQPENLVLESENSDRLKIIDFGLSRRLEVGSKECDIIGTPEFVGKLETITFDS